jgi:hypothetical protein
MSVSLVDHSAPSHVFNDYLAMRTTRAGTISPDDRKVHVTQTVGLSSFFFCVLQTDGIEGFNNISIQGD